MAPFTCTRRQLRLARLTVVLMTISLAAQAWAFTAGNRVDLKVLVISANGGEPTFEAWTAALDREGVPYETIIANTAGPIGADTLASASDHGRYQAVVLATGGLVQCTAFLCSSALEPAEWLALNAYQAKFGVRRVTAYTWPSPEYGLNYPFASGDLAGTQGQLTVAGKAEFPYLVGAVPMDTGTWGYSATPLAPAAGASPAFTTLVAGAADTAGVASSLVGVYARPDGFEELVVTYDSNAFQMQSLLLAHGLLAWATQGVRLGYQRNYFTVHVDDILLPDDRWDVNDKVTYEDGGATNPLIRMVPSDVERALVWQQRTGLQMDFVFNGAGSVDAIAENGSDPLTTSLLQNRSKFNWINHTWSHPNLDNFSAKKIYMEIKKNLQWAKANKIKTNGRELVTGEHSGLANPAMVKALRRARVRWIASDNSKQPDPYLVGKTMAVPRHPSNLYYNVGTFEEQLDEYNHIYYYNCSNTPTTTCFSAPATWENYVDSEATIMLRHVLTNDPRPHYVHQANLAEDGTMYPVVDELLKRYDSYVNAPIEQPVFSAVGRLMKRRAAWLASSWPSLTLVDGYHLNGYIHLRSKKRLTLPVTGTTLGKTYGGERSGWVKLRRGRTMKLAVLAN